MEPLASAIIGHLVGDYLLQNDWMASKKKKETWPCFVHVSLYTLAIIVFTGWLDPLVISSVFIPHFMIDRWLNVKAYMTKVGQRDFANNLSPWSIIIVDNSIHMMCLWISAWYAANH